MSVRSVDLKSTALSGIDLSDEDSSLLEKYVKGVRASDSICDRYLESVAEAVELWGAHRTSYSNTMALGAELKSRGILMGGLPMKDLTKIQPGLIPIDAAVSDVVESVPSKTENKVETISTDSEPDDSKATASMTLASRLFEMQSVIDHNGSWWVVDDISLLNLTSVGRAYRTMCENAGSPVHFPRAVNRLGAVDGLDAELLDAYDPVVLHRTAYAMQFTKRPTGGEVAEYLRDVVVSYYILQGYTQAQIIKTCRVGGRAVRETVDIVFSGYTGTKFSKLKRKPRVSKPRTSKPSTSKSRTASDIISDLPKLNTENTPYEYSGFNRDELLSFVNGLKCDGVTLPWVAYRLRVHWKALQYRLDTGCTRDEVWNYIKSNKQASRNSLNDLMDIAFGKGR